MKKLNEMADYEVHFGYFGKMTSAFLANKYATLLGKKEIESNEKIKASKNLFADKMVMTDLKTVDLILADVNTFIKTLK